MSDKRPTGWQYNKNGNLTEEQMIELVNKPKEEFAEWLSNLRISNHPCPPKKLIALQCFYCGECFLTAFDAIKSKLKRGKK